MKIRIFGYKALFFNTGCFWRPYLSFLTDHKLINRYKTLSFWISRVLFEQRLFTGKQDRNFDNILVVKTIQVFRYPLNLFQTQRHKKASLLQVELHILSVSECTFSSPRFTLRAPAKHNGDKPRLKKNERGAQDLSH